jgi:thiamine biosynthesis lipoprotein ApbE
MSASATMDDTVGTGKTAGKTTGRTTGKTADTTAAATWRALGTQIRVVVTEPRRLAEAERMLVADVAALDTACSRFRTDSEIRSLTGSAANGTKGPCLKTEVSPLLAQAIAAALRAARLTDGDVDPTVGAAMSAAGYDCDFSLLTPAGPPDERAGRGGTGRGGTGHGGTGHGGRGRQSGKLSTRAVPGWRNVHLDGRLLTMPADVQLDLGATAKAWAADRSARRIANDLDCGVLVSMGGDIAVAGTPPRDGWRIRVQDVTGDPQAPPMGPYALIAIHSGGLATSSTTARRWRRGGDVLHHILDPRTGLPAEIVWRTVSVTAGTCADANAASTAAIIRGRAAMTWLTAHNLPARLVDSKGAVFTVAGWPAPDQAPDPAPAPAPDPRRAAASDRGQR